MATIAENLNIIESVKGEIKDILSLDNHWESYPNAIAEAVTDEAELQTISERTTADGASIKDSVAYVKSIHGNCVKWNQLANFTPKTENGVTFSRNSDGSIGISGTPTATTTITVVNITSNHKLLIVVNGATTSLIQTFKDTSTYIDYSSNSRIITGNVVKIRVGGQAYNERFFFAVFDLTAMGWEDITSADAFAQRLGYDNASSLPYFAYDEGSIKTFNATKIVSKDSDGETIGELSTDIPSLFTDGLCSAGTAYDEVTKNKAVKRIGKVDLGTLTWAYQSSGSVFAPFFYASVNFIPHKGHPSQNKYPILCLRYKTTSRDSNFVNNCICADGDNARISQMQIKDSSFDGDITAFKASLSGLYLYYELATPTEQTLTERKSWYKVSANGKEQIVGTNSAPMKAEIAYRYISEVATTALDEETNQ